MTREELIKVMARAIEPNMPVQVKYWQEGKIQHATMVFPGDPEYVSPVPAALAALAALEAAGVRLVPVEATADMLNAAFDAADGHFRIDGDAGPWLTCDGHNAAFNAALAASPYAKDKPE